MSEIVLWQEICKHANYRLKGLKGNLYIFFERRAWAPTMGFSYSILQPVKSPAGDYVGPIETPSLVWVCGSKRVIVTSPCTDCRFFDNLKISRLIVDHV